MTSTIRPARPEDADAIQRVARAAWHAAYDSIIGADAVEETVDGWYAPGRLVADDIEPAERPFYVATAGGRVIGFVEAAPDGDRETLAHLYRIYVLPDRWGEGTGRELLQRAESTLRDRGFERLRVIVLADNDIGVRFYEATGFERVGAQENERFGVREYEYEKRL